MLIGSVAAGYRAVDLMSLVSSAHRNGLDVFVCVKDVLDRLLARATNYDALRPDGWKQAHPEAIQIYRVEERQARADAKAVKRARRRIAKRSLTGFNRLHPLRGPHGRAWRSLRTCPTSLLRCKLTTSDLRRPTFTARGPVMPVV